MIEISAQLLRDPEREPSDEVLKSTLGDDFYALYRKIQHIFKEEGLSTEWRYYKDGKAWLCKVAGKKKTILWLSAWDAGFKVSFYFTEKTKEGVSGLAIADEIKGSFARAVPVGKLIPLTIDLKNVFQLEDLRKIAVYKKELK